jgi:threonyl-tRNA synthetase
MIHRVVFGSIERFNGILTEHFAGKFPLWLAPVQIVLLPMNEELAEYAAELKKTFESEGLRTEIDQRNESLKKKVRDAQLSQIPLILTVGKKEKEENTVAVRTLDGTVKQGMPVDNFMKTVKEHIKARKMNLDIFAE